MAPRCFIALAIVVFFAVIGNIAAQDTEEVARVGKVPVTMAKCYVEAAKYCARALPRPMTFTACMLKYFGDNEEKCSIKGMLN